METKRHELTDSEWDRIKDMLPPEHPKEGERGRPAKYDNRRIMKGILWIARNGAPWRELPERYVDGGGDAAQGVSTDGQIKRADAKERTGVEAQAPSYVK